MKTSIVKTRHKCTLCQLGIPPLHKHYLFTNGLRTHLFCDEYIKGVIRPGCKGNPHFLEETMNTRQVNMLNMKTEQLARDLIKYPDMEKVVEDNHRQWCQSNGFYDVNNHCVSYAKTGKLKRAIC